MGSSLVTLDRVTVRARVSEPVVQFGFVLNGLYEMGEISLLAGGKQAEGVNT